MQLNLKMVSIDKIDIPTECSRSKIEFYSYAIQRHKSLRNPLAVFKDGGKYILLDEPEILSALGDLNVSSAPVQIISDERQISVASETYYDNLSREIIFDFAAKFPRDLTLGDSPDHKDISAEINYFDGETIYCSFKNKSNGTIPRLFLDFITLLKSQCRLIGKTGFGETAGSNIRTLAGNSLIRVLNVNWDLIRQTIDSGIALPSETFSFEYIGRVLGIDFPLEILISDSDLNQKAMFLNELLNLRQSCRLSRYYGNGVYIMNY